MKLIRVLMSSLAVTLLATSCASFPKNRLPQVTEASFSKSKKVSLTYTLSAGNSLTGTREAASEEQKEIYAKALKSAAEKSGRFSSVKQGKGGAVHVNIDVLTQANGAAAYLSGFISGFTFTVIPAVASENYKLSADSKSRKYVLEDGSTFVIWAPMIFAMPTNSPNKVIPKVHENLFANLFLQMERDSLLK